ncbi:DUF4342 domain-containing protein [Clostridium sp. KNHs214]|uniref:DUF4342 domain-containing protein n=1 Tax=Clostridium sp. KNHs214 TaxID=1540257 RepID=UPI00055521FA|nr:DUF4342 domain-containing protein [Clostridium sp. KNHs214]
MSDVTLEKIDMIIERTGVSYTEAKEALEACEGDVVEALVYIESNKKDSSLYTTKEEFITWIKDLIKKGQATRIKIKKDDKVLVDMPVNAGVAAGVISLIWWPIAATLLVTAVFAKITVEITKKDGTVEVVNKIIKTKASEVKDIVKDAGSDIKEKINSKMNKDKCEEESDNVYQYTVNFDEDEKEDNNKY